MASFGTRAQSPRDQTLSRPSTRRVGPTTIRPRSSRGSPNRAQQRVRLDTRRPDERAGLDPRPVGEGRRAVLRRRERRRHADVDAALDEAVGCVLAQARGDLREDLRRRVHEHPALRRVAHGRVVAQGVANEVGQLGERFDTRVPRADEDERELALGLARVGRGRGGLEPAEDVVAQVDGVREALEPERVLGQAGDRKRPRHRPERDHEVVVLDVLLPGVRDDVHPPSVLVDRRRAAEEQLRVRAHHPQGDDDVARLERPRGGLGQHRRVEHEVLGADDRRARPPEQPPDVAAGEAAPDDERSATRGAGRGRHAASHIIGSCGGARGPGDESVVRALRRRASRRSGRANLQLRVHVLPRMHRGDGLDLPELRRRARPAAAARGRPGP